jgi:hypothetical protein
MDFPVNADSPDFSIYFDDYVNSTAGYVYASVDYANVPSPSAFMLMFSGISGASGIARRKAVPALEQGPGINRIRRD